MDVTVRGFCSPERRSVRLRHDARCTKAVFKGLQLHCFQVLSKAPLSNELCSWSRAAVVGVHAYLTTQTVTNILNIFVKQEQPGNLTSRLPLGRREANILVIAMFLGTFLSLSIRENMTRNLFCQKCLYTCLCSEYVSLHTHRWQMNKHLETWYLSTWGLRGELACCGIHRLLFPGSCFHQPVWRMSSSSWGLH